MMAAMSVPALCQERIELARCHGIIVRDGRCRRTAPGLTTQPHKQSQLPQCPAKLAQPARALIHGSATDGLCFGGLPLGKESLLHRRQHVAVEIPQFEESKLPRLYVDASPETVAYVLHSEVHLTPQR